MAGPVVVHTASTVQMREMGCNESRYAIYLIQNNFVKINLN